MKQAHDVVLHPEELNILHYSMCSVHRAIFDRVEKLQGKDSDSYLLRCVPVDDLQWLIVITAIYKLHNVNKEQKLQTIFFGLVHSYLSSDARR